jgi:L-2-hydroxyglutarate oxidase LhgO
MAQLRDEFHDLTPNARRAEIMAGEESKFAPYIAQLYSKGSGARPVGEEAVVPSAEVVARLKGREGATSAAGMKRGGLRVKTKKAKTKEELLTQLAALDKKKKRAARSARARSLAQLTPTIRGRPMTAAKGGLMKNKHTDYRAGGLFYKKAK